MQQCTWQWRALPGLKSIADSKLKKMFQLPKFSFIFPDKPIYHELNLEKYTTVTYDGKKKALHCLFHSDLSRNPNMEQEWWWYSHAKGGSAVSYGPGLMFNPQVAAQQTAFWLPLEIWAVFPEKYNDFQKGLTMSVRLDKDNVPIKTKRIWMKHYIEALQGYVGK